VDQRETLRRQRDAQALGDAREVGLTPAVTKQKRNRQCLGKLRRPEAIGCADDLGEEIVGLKFRKEQRDERTRPREIPRAGSDKPHCTPTKLAPPVLGVDLLARTGSRIELPGDIDEQLA
jgi:hypothetical protein